MIGVKPVPPMPPSEEIEKQPPLMTLAQSLLAPQAARIYILKADNERYFLDAVRELGLEPRRLGALPDTRGEHEQDRVVYTLVDDFPMVR